MKTRTIYDACDGAEKIWNPYRNEYFDTYPAKRVDRAERQTRTFYAELLRRMDERDTLVAEKDDRIARLQALHAAKPGVKPWSSDKQVTP